MSRRHLLILPLLIALLSCSVYADDEPASYDPVRNGEVWTFTDPLYGYSISYPDSFKLKAAPEIMRKVRDAAGELPAKDSEGSRFTMGAVKLSTGGIIPSLTGRVAGLSPGLGAVTNQEWAERSAQALLKDLDATLLGPVKPVVINDLTYYRIEYKYLYARKKMQVVCRTYCHYDEVARLVYMFTLNTPEKNAERNFEALEVAMKTVRIAKKPGPVPVEVKGPSGMAW